MSKRCGLAATLFAMCLLSLSCDDGGSSDKTNNGNACTASDNECIDPHTARVCGSNGKFETITCSGTKPDCWKGECIGNGDSKTCTEADNTCLDDHTANVCDNGTMKSISCTGNTPDCREGKCIASNSGKTCTEADNICLDDHTASVCDNDGTMKSISCTGNTPDCREGKCIANNSGKTCTESDNTCLDDHTANVCDNDGTMKRVSCTGETPDCKGGTCIPGQTNQGCTNGELQCDGNIPKECIDGTWHSSDACTAPTPVCSTASRDTRCISECSENDPAYPPICLENNIRRFCNNGKWDEEQCSGATPICNSKPGMNIGICEEICENGLGLCDEKAVGRYFCDNDGLVEFEYCPDETPYCFNGARVCTELKQWDDCTASKFQPFTRNGNLYLCMINTNTSNFTARVVVIPCYGECIEAEDGYGAATANAKSCGSYGEDSFSGITGVDSKYKTCFQCKRDKNGQLKYLAVPSSYTYTGLVISKSPTGIYSCTPYEIEP